MEEEIIACRVGLDKWMALVDVWVQRLHSEDGIGSWSDDCIWL